MSRPKLTADQHRRNGTPYRAPASTAPPRPPLDGIPEPLEPLGPAGARLWAHCWQVWAKVLTAGDIPVLTNLARLADQAETMDALVEAAPDDKKAMAGRLAVSARFRFTSELARVTKQAENAMEH